MTQRYLDPQERARAPHVARFRELTQQRIDAEVSGQTLPRGASGEHAELKKKMLAAAKLERAVPCYTCGKKVVMGKTDLYTVIVYAVVRHPGEAGQPATFDYLTHPNNVGFATGGRGEVILLAPPEMGELGHCEACIQKHLVPYLAAQEAAPPAAVDDGTTGKSTDGPAPEKAPVTTRRRSTKRPARAKR